MQAQHRHLLLDPAGFGHATLQRVLKYCESIAPIERGSAMPPGMIALLAVGAAALARAALTRSGVKSWLLSILVPLGSATIVGFLGGFADTLVPVTVDQMMDEAKRLPMVRVLVENEPDAATRVRASMVKLADAHTQEEREAAATNARAVLASLRAEYVAPAIKRAPDEDVKLAWKAYTALFQHLQTSNILLCKQMFSTGLQNTNDLDEAGKKLFFAALSSEERMYVDGRKQTNSAPLLSDTNFAAAVAHLNLSASDIAALQNLAGASDADACGVAVDYYNGANSLDEASRIPFMRTSLAVQ